MKTLGLIYAIAAAVSWGLVYAIDQKILEKVTPLAFVFASGLFAALVTLPILLINDTAALRGLMEFSKNNSLLMIFALALAILASFFILSAVKLIGANTASIFEIAYPFFVVIFTYLLYRQVVGWPFLAGALLIFGGALIIIKYA